MSVYYCNVYSTGERPLNLMSDIGGVPLELGESEEMAKDVRRTNGKVEGELLQRRMHVNDCWHRPPVGMRADQTSHRWAWKQTMPDCDVSAGLELSLEPRA